MLALRIALLTAACLPALTAASWGKESLKGITSFSVSVVLEGSCTQIITVDRLRTDVELKLRSAGLSLKDNAYHEDGGAEVTASIACLPIVQGGRTTAWAAGHRLSVTQGVNLRQSQGSVLAETWSSDSMLFGPASVIENNIRSSIRDSVEEFLNDYLAVNARK
jgi:hypothetical protein